MIEEKVFEVRIKDPEPPTARELEHFLEKFLTRVFVKEKENDSKQDF